LQGPPSDAAAQEHRAARLAAVRTHDPRFVDTPHGAGACGGCWRAGDSATKCRPKGGGSFNHGPVETTDAAGRVKGGADFDSTLLGKHVTVVRVVNDPTEFGGVVTAFDHATGAHTVDTAAGVRTHYLAYFPRTRMTIAGARCVVRARCRVCVLTSARWRARRAGCGASGAPAKRATSARRPG
jgi:hypothetical protein